MLDLDFEVEAAEPERHAATPLIAFKLRIAERPAAGAVPSRIRNIALTSQICIQPARRRYVAEEQVALEDLFGTPERWRDTLHPLQWTCVNLFVPGFTGTCVVSLIVPCSWDFSLAATRYFHGVTAGDAPLCFLFSGTVFYETADGLQAAPIPWAKEAYFRLRADVWHGIMDAHYPNTGWVSLRRDVFERLLRFRSSQGLATWEQAVEALLTAAEEPVLP